jgi:hypothetical protein
MHEDVAAPECRRIQFDPGGHPGPLVIGFNMAVPVCVLDEDGSVPTPEVSFKRAAPVAKSI